MLGQKGWLIIDKCQNELNNDNLFYIGRMLANRRESYNGIMQESQVISTPFWHLSVIYWTFWFVCPQLQDWKTRVVQNESWSTIKMTKQNTYKIERTESFVA